MRILPPACMLLVLAAILPLSASAERVFCQDFDGGETKAIYPGTGNNEGMMISHDESWNQLETGDNGEFLERGMYGAAGTQGLRVTYDASGFDKGTPRINNDFVLPPAEQYTLKFDVLFEDGFEFVRGGKLHGLSTNPPANGGFSLDSDDAALRWSSRIMWRKDGNLSHYLYHQKRSENKGTVLWSPYAFPVGRWVAITLQTMANTPAQPNGMVRLFMDGELMVTGGGTESAIGTEGGDITVDNLTFRGDVDPGMAQIGLFRFTTFFGGNDDSWAPSKPVSASFDNFAVEQGITAPRTAAGADDCSSLPAEQVSLDATSSFSKCKRCIRKQR